MSDAVTCVWTTSTELVLALDQNFGEPGDMYVNGSQVWHLDNGPGEIGLEWRLHPVSGFKRPSGVDQYELFEAVAFDLRTGGGRYDPLVLWDGLEAFACWGDEVEPAPLARACTEALGIAPSAYGLADHHIIGDAWEQSLGKVSIVDALLTQLRR